MSERIITQADTTIAECIKANQSFSLVAGAGSGKTASLVDALDLVRTDHGANLRQSGRRVACVTYTNRAVDIIRERLGTDTLYNISTLHSFLWGEIGRFHSDIRQALKDSRIPALIEKSKEDDNGGNSQKATRARQRVAQLEEVLAGIDGVDKFSYEDAAFSDYLDGQLSHDDVIEVAGYLLSDKPNFRRLLGMRYSHIFVDEAQDTFPQIIAGLNITCAGDGLPIVGYFGDPWQQIYDGRAGNFEPPEGGQVITKVENFRSAPEVITLLNAFRGDVEQIPAGENKDVKGSVSIRLVQAQKGEAPRNRYTEEQLNGVLAEFDNALKAWGWQERDDVIRLFLVRQMIARRLGFYALNQLFVGRFASQRAQDDFEAGEHYLLKPFVELICPLLAANRSGDQRAAINILRLRSPFYSTNGANASKSLKEMIIQSKQHLDELATVWGNGSIRDVLNYCSDNELLSVSPRLQVQLERDVREEEYNDDEYGNEKGDWLADTLFAMPTDEIESYCKFISANTPYNTQHGVKGDEFGDVLVVYDDVEASWNNYSFTKLLTPLTSGEPTDGQRERGRKLAYVSFSRAQQNLRILLFTLDPEQARQELIQSGLFLDEQIEIAE